MTDHHGRWRLLVDGAAGPILPTWTSYRAQLPASGVGGVDLSLPAAAPGAATLLDDPWCGLVYEVMDGDGQWFEPPNGRFVILSRQMDTATDVATVKGASLGWLLGRVVRWPMPWAEDDQGKVTLAKATAGHVAQWFYYWAAVRAAVANIAIDWDAGQDSDGVPWSRIMTAVYERGVTWRQVMDGLASDGIVWRFDAQTMRVAQGRFADVPAGAPMLYDGLDVTVDRVEQALDDVAGTVLALGSDNEYGQASVGVVPPWGRWDVSVSHSGTSDRVALGRLSADDLLTRGASMSSATITLLPTSRIRPWVDLVPGQETTVIIDPDQAPVWRWDQSRWDSTVPWGEPTPWHREVSGQVLELVAAGTPDAETVSATIGARRLAANETLTRTVTALTGGRVARGTLTGQA